jgi:type II secretory pathway component PulK
MMRRDRDRSGVVLLVVLFFALLLTSSITTFMRRATFDAMIARNREAAAQADALARGGVRLATALLMDDKQSEEAEGQAFDTYRDAWRQARHSEIATEGGGSLRLRIEDAGARLNLNALFDATTGLHLENTPDFLEAVLEKVVDEMELAPGERLYDPRELAENLIDWIDRDEDRVRGGPEDAYYQDQDPPYRAWNAPLMSVDELRLIEGFDGPLVEALRPYVTVYPFILGAGINPNTAPPYVLSLLFFDDGVDLRLADEDTIRDLLEEREEGRILCPQGNSSEGCTPIRQIVTNAIFPPPSFASDIFTVVAEARVGEVTRSVEAVVDRGPEVHEYLAWRVR